MQLTRDTLTDLNINIPVNTKEYFRLKNFWDSVNTKSVFIECVASVCMIFSDTVSLEAALHWIFQHGVQLLHLVMANKMFPQSSTGIDYPKRPHAL
jgi:hypothetical protein